MTIRIADEHDLDTLCRYDRHISRAELARIVPLGRVYLAEQEGVFLGWLRFGLFWDNTPFLSMLYLLEDYRSCGYGRELLSFWERRMREEGYKTLLTSTVSDECAQHFYYQAGWRTIGGFLLNDDPYELMLAKNL